MRLFLEHPLLTPNRQLQIVMTAPAFQILRILISFLNLVTSGQLETSISW